MEEIWRDIEGYKGIYQVSNKGNVKSLKYGKERILKSHDDENGYLRVPLRKEGSFKFIRIHRLVAQAFIQNPENKPQVNHLDENKKNNCVDNLEWTTNIDNCNYGTRNERISRKILQYSKSGEFIREWQSSREVERVLGINHSNIIQCCKGKLQSAGGFVWRYKEKD